MALLEEMKYQGNILFKFRGTLPFIILIPGWILAFQHNNESNISSDNFWKESYPFICLGVAMMGLFIRVYTVGYTPANTSGRNTEEQLADTLNTTGIYSAVRHPLYVGNFLMWLGVGMLTYNFWFLAVFVLLYWLYYERIMFVEEQFLRNKFEHRYLEWATRTPAFVPSLRWWQPPALPFSFKKVLKKEKNSVLYLFLVFFFFETVPDLIHQNHLSPEDWFWTGSMITALCFYITLKIIRNRTSLLDEQGR